MTDLKDEDYRASLDRIDRFARLMDSDWRVPGTRLRFGLDGLVGLIPGIGDLAGAALSLFVIAEGIRMKVGKGLILKMVGNVAVELVVGLVPILGDAFDFYWKSNRRNSELLRRRILKELEPPPPPQKGAVGGFLWLLALIALGILMALWIAAL